MLPRVAITMGDPAGIGPEIVLKALTDPRIASHAEPLVVGSRTLLQRCAQALHLPMVPAPQLIEPAFPAGSEEACTPGSVSRASGLVAAACVELAIAGCQDGRFAAMATGPISKHAIQLAGIPFAGHTEWLAARCQVPEPTMLMYHGQLAVALVTCHLALSSAIAGLTTPMIVRTGRALDQALRRLRGAAPRLAVLGLNPHAGEDGLLGWEDQAVVAPAVAQLQAEGISASGPLPPDAAFTPLARQRFDGWVCLYHDQGLIPFKALAFDQGVNLTLNLPLVRTSVDHGTACDIAWTGVAQHASLVEAVLLAARLCSSPGR